jgi:hypothetical protein
MNESDNNNSKESSGPPRILEGKQAIDKIVLRYINKLITNAKVLYEYDVSTMIGEERNDDGDVQMAKFIHILIKTYPGLKCRYILEQEGGNIELSIEQLLIEGGLINISFLHHLMYDYKYRFQASGIIFMLQSIITHDLEHSKNLFAETYINDILDVNDEQMSKHICEAYGLEDIIDICIKVIEDVDDFERCGNFLSGFWSKLLEMKLVESIYDFLNQIFTSDIITDMHGSVIKNRLQFNTLS